MRKFREGRRTPLVAAIGIAGAVVVSCSGPPAYAEPPPAHPCDELVPTLRVLHENASKGLPVAFLKHLAMTDPGLGGVGRYTVVQIIAAIDQYPQARSFTAAEFLGAGLGLCKALYGQDHLTGTLDRIPGMEHGDI